MKPEEIFDEIKKLQNDKTITTLSIDAFRGNSNIQNSAELMSSQMLGIDLAAQWDKWDIIHQKRMMSNTLCVSDGKYRYMKYVPKAEQVVNRIYGEIEPSLCDLLTSCFGLFKRNPDEIIYSKTSLTDKDSKKETISEQDFDNICKQLPLPLQALLIERQKTDVGVQVSVFGPRRSFN